MRYPSDAPDADTYQRSAHEIHERARRAVATAREDPQEA